MNASPRDTELAAHDALNSELSLQAQRDTRAFWARAAPERGYALESQRMLDDVKAQSPFLGTLLANPFSVGMMDLMGATKQSLTRNASVQAASGPVRTRRDLFQQQAAFEVGRDMNAWQDSWDPFTLIGGSLAHRLAGDKLQEVANQRIAARTNELVANAQAHGLDVNRPLRIAQGSQVELGPATITALQGTTPQSGAFNRANAATGNSVPPEHRARG